MKTLFIYHGGCFDGFTAAWVYSRFVDRDAEFLPAKYGDPAPDVRGRNVVIADFSYPRDVMFKIACDAEALTVLDHHVTAQEALDGLEKQVLLETGKEIRVVFDMERSGAGITWDEAVDFKDKLAWMQMTGQGFRGQRLALVNYVEDRDLWRMSLPKAHEYMANVYAAPMTFESWDELHARKLESMLTRGEGILAYMEQYGTKALDEAHQLRWPKLWRVRWAAAPDDNPRQLVWCVNMPYMNCSDYLNRLLAEKGTPFVASYFRRADGRWQFSLRSTPEFDCSAVAKLFGGGGHKQASGFDVADLAEVFA